MAKAKLINERYDAKNGESIRLNETQKDGFVITTYRHSSRVAYKEEEIARGAYKLLCDYHDGKAKNVRSFLGSNNKKKPSGGEKLPPKPKGPAKPSFGVGTWKACLEKKVIHYSKSDGFSYGNNALGKSRAAGIKEIKSNVTLLKNIKKDLKNAK